VSTAYYGPDNSIMCCLLFGASFLELCIMVSSRSVNSNWIGGVTLKYCSFGSKQIIFTYFWIVFWYHQRRCLKVCSNIFWARLLLHTFWQLLKKKYLLFQINLFQFTFNHTWYNINVILNIVHISLTKASFFTAYSLTAFLKMYLLR